METEQSPEPWQITAVRAIMNNPQATNYRLVGSDVSWEEPYQGGTRTKTWRRVACTSAPVQPPEITQ